MREIVVLCAALVAAGCSARDARASGTIQAPAPPEDKEVAVFAGGCFWCMEKPFETIDGVVSVESGYTGGPEKAPTYKEVASHGTGHLEAIRVVYDPANVTYERLLQAFWHNIDPLDDRGQFCDKGHQYTTAIFTSDPAEKKSAEASKKAVAEQLGAEVVTKILPAAPFWLAEDYHQDFYRKNPGRYTSYRTGCGRDARLRELWGDGAGH